MLFFHQVDIQKISLLVYLGCGCILLLFALQTTISHLQYSSLPHVESITNVVLCSYLQGFCVVLISLHRIVNAKRHIEPSQTLHLFLLSVIVMITLTHVIIILVSMYHLSRINDSTPQIPSIEHQYACCGWLNINTMQCKSLSGIRADRTCSSSVGNTFHLVIPRALILNLCLMLFTIYLMVLSIWREYDPPTEIVPLLVEDTVQLQSESLITPLLDDSENANDLISNYMEVGSNDEDNVDDTDNTAFFNELFHNNTNQRTTQHHPLSIQETIPINKEIGSNTESIEDDLI
ncbi:Transmembrane protein [Entamoeba marina]